MKWHRRILLLFLLFMVATPLLSFFSVPPVQAVFGPEDIYMEYGAESEVLQPPFGFVATWGSPETKIEFEHSIVQSGTVAIKFTTDTTSAQAQGYEQARAQLSWHEGHAQALQLDELYCSWWLYLPTVYDIDSGGWDMCFDFHWRVQGVAWYNLVKIYIQKHSSGNHRLRDYPAYGVGDRWSSVNIPKNQWVHYQMYYKLGVADGAYTVWQDDVEIFSHTNIDTRHSPYGSWEGEADYIGSHGFKLYPDPDAKDGLVKYADNIVIASEKVPEDYNIDYPDIQFEFWEDGFESGDFSAWNGTQQGGGGVAPSVTSTYAKYGTYSANFTTDGADDSYSRAMHIIQNTTEVYQRSYVMFEDLPDTDNTRLLVLRIAQEEGTWITSAGVNRTGGNYFWYISETDGTANYTLDIINIDDWHEVEYHFNTTIGELWINNTLMCQMNGDFSDSGNLARVYPYLYVEGAQISAKTVYHDNYRVDNVRIGGGTPRTFQASLFLSATSEVNDPLEFVTINGTRVTDENGLYEWTDLTYNTEYLFVVGNATGYYPAWCLGVDGSYYWNGSDWLITHNVTEDQTGYIQMAFFESSQPYIHYTDAMLTSASMDTNGTSILSYTGDDSGAKTVEVYSATQPTYVMGKSYNSSTDYIGTTFNMSYTFSGEKTFALSWQDFDGVVVNATTGELSTVSTWERQMLTLYITDTGPSTTDVYASSLGEPHWVLGEQSWSFNDTTSMVYVVVAHSSEEEVEISWATWLFTFRGLYDERTGFYLSDVDVTAYYINLTSTSFTVDETYYFSSDSEPLYFLFDLTPYDRQYWIHSAENDTTIYILNASTTVYTVAFLDLAGALDDYPYVEVKHYLNGTLQTVEKRRVDEEKKIQASLMEGETYSVVIRDGTAYTYGDLLMTSTTTLQLTLKGIQFPKDTLLMYKNVRIYGDRIFDVPNGSIAITYADELNQTNTVDIYINYKNGTNVYNGTETSASFIHTWSSAMNDTDYRVVATMNHSRYGVTTWNQYFPRGGYADAPWSLDFLGIRLPFDTNIILPSLLILMIAGAGVKVKPEVGAFLAVVTAIIFTLLRWLPLGTGALITAFTLAILMAVIYKRWRVRM